jgi:L-cysteine/cystine lyase
VRAELPAAERKAYLNAGTFGPLPSRAVDAMQDAERAALREGRFGRAFFDDVLAARQALREAVGRTIGAPASAIALTTSTSEGCNTVVAGLRLGPEDEVVTTDSEHPGLAGPLELSPARVRVAAVGRAPAAEALAVIEAELSERTRLIALSHVTWTTGQVIPVGDLSGRGIPVLVDGAQSAGAVPVDVGALGCDFYTVSGQKWLLGPDATGALYVRPESLGLLAMTSTSYVSWEDPRAFVPWPDARRFETTWVPHPAVRGLLASIAFAEELGPERFERARAVAEVVRERAAGRAEVVTEAGQATLVSVRPRNDPAADVVKRLEAAGVVVRDLPGLGWVRASCGYWTSQEDVDRFVAGL